MNHIQTNLLKGKQLEENKTSLILEKTRNSKPQKQVLVVFCTNMRTNLWMF